MKQIYKIITAVFILIILFYLGISITKADILGCRNENGCYDSSNCPPGTFCLIDNFCLAEYREANAVFYGNAYSLYMDLSSMGLRSILVPIEHIVYDWINIGTQGSGYFPGSGTTFSGPETWSGWVPSYRVETRPGFIPTLPYGYCPNCYNQPINEIAGGPGIKPGICVSISTYCDPPSNYFVYRGTYVNENHINIYKSIGTCTGQGYPIRTVMQDDEADGEPTDCTDVCPHCKPFQIDTDNDESWVCAPGCPEEESSYFYIVDTNSSILMGVGEKGCVYAQNLIYLYGGNIDDIDDVNGSFKIRNRAGETVAAVIIKDKKLGISTLYLKGIMVPGGVSSYWGFATPEWFEELYLTDSSFVIKNRDDEVVAIITEDGDFYKMGSLTVTGKCYQVNDAFPANQVSCVEF